MDVKYLLIIFTLTLSSCKTTTNEEPSIIVDPKDASDELLTNIFSKLDVIEIKCSDSLYFGNIDFVKTYDHYVFLHDQYQTKSLTIINTLNEKTFQFRKIGRGPGEYNNIDAFTLDKKNNLLYIYERGIGFKTYSFPEFEFIQKIDYHGEYLMNIEVVNNKLLVFSEKLIDDGLYEGAQMLDPVSLNTTPLNLPNNPSTIELSYPNTISKNNDVLYYASPGAVTKVFEIYEDNCQQVSSISFGEYDIPHKYWGTDDAHEFESAFTQKERATWVHNLINESNYMSFSFMFNEPENIKFVIYDKKKNKCKVVSTISLCKDGNPIGAPIGTLGNKNVFLIYPELIKDLYPNSCASNELRNKLDKCLENNNPSLLICEI